MATSFGTCPKHHIKYRGRCPKCHPRCAQRRSSSRPVSGRRQHAMNLDRILRIDTPKQPARRYVTTFDAASRWLNRNGKTWAELSNPEYGWLMERSARLADRWHRLFAQADLEIVG